eukprot:1488625-Prorocentrum_lima.AAC.1
MRQPPPPLQQLPPQLLVLAWASSWTGIWRFRPGGRTAPPGSDPAGRTAGQAPSAAGRKWWPRRMLRRPRSLARLHHRRRQPLA